MPIAILSSSVGSLLPLRDEFLQRVSENVSRGKRFLRTGLRRMGGKREKEGERRGKERTEGNRRLRCGAVTRFL